MEATMALSSHVHGMAVRRTAMCLHSGLVVVLSLSFLSPSASFVTVPAAPSLRLGSTPLLRSCFRPHRAASARPQLFMMSSPDENEEKTLPTKTEEEDAALMELDISERKVKAKEMRQEATDLEETASGLRKDAVKKEQLAAKLRIRAWKLEGSVSAVTNEINIGNKYERQLAELDIMAEDWIDTDEEKWDWYQKQREMITEMIESQKYYDQQADEQIKDLKEVLGEVSTLLNVQALDSKGEITSVGWGFVLLSVVIPLFVGYEIFNWLSSSSAAFFGSLSGSKDPFDSL